jgi:hypothetical protein
LRARLALLAAAAALLVPAAPADSASSAAGYLQLARAGIAQAHAGWWDGRRRWYDEVLGGNSRYPLATIWAAVPLFESVDAVAIAQPSPSNRKAVNGFARGAERYWDRALSPHGGYAPYPGDRGKVRAWFDDNGWWGLAFFDAFRATHGRRWLGDAARAFNYGVAAGWDRSGGGLWWNTSHPYKAGEALASHALLGAELYRATHKRLYLANVQKYIAWADRRLWSDRDGLYARSDRDSTPMPYVNGPLIYAHQVLCEATGDQSWCRRASTLADRAYDRFASLSMGPQFDAIYLRTMLEYGRDAQDGRWHALAVREAQRAQDNARDGSGRYMRSWSGSGSFIDAKPGVLRTHAGTVSVFAWLAAVPSG